MSEYIDGVPVKISEKYKPPKKIELPIGIPEIISRANNLLESANYDLTFEENVLSKLEELKKAKENAQNELKHRLQLYKEAKEQREHDQEAQEKLRLLNVSKVSYPSTEEINDYKIHSVLIPSNDHSNTVDPNILQPIQITSFNQQNLLDDPDPLSEMKLNTKLSRVKLSNVDKLTVEDFENDTSSPFDNVELKTINDMDILAEVLHKQKTNGVSTSQSYSENYNNYYNGSSVSYPGYNVTSNFYLPNCDILNYNSSYYGHNMYNNTHYYENNTYQPVYPEVCEIPGKSRVKQILTELDEVIANNRERNVNKCIDLSKHHSPEAGVSKSPSKPVSPNKEELPNPYHELSQESRDLCDCIASMGFPVDRVARVCQLIGTNDDKKIIEGLLSVGQLMDLGFTECLVTSALWRHNFNRDDALDELVS